MGAHENLGVFEDSSVTTAGITAARASTNTIDLVQTKPQIGVGQHSPYLCIRTSAAPTDAADSLSIELQSDADDGAGAPVGTWDHVVMMPLTLIQASGEVIATDDRLAVAGAWIYRGQLPYDIKNRHIRLYYNNTISNGRFLIDAWLEDVPASDFRGAQVLFSDVGQP